MKTKSILIILVQSLMAISSLFAQTVKPEKIDNLKIQSQDLPTEFVLYQERIAQPGVNANEQVHKNWRRRSSEQDLELIEETIQQINKPVGSSLSQNWYRGKIKGEKDKMEINIIISQTEDDLEKTILYFTQEAYAAPFQITQIPLAGEKSWILKDSLSNSDSFTIMFSKLNVFVRVYVRMKDLKIEELQQVTEEISFKIENKIRL